MLFALFDPNDVSNGRIILIRMDESADCKNSGRLCTYLPVVDEGAADEIMADDEYCISSWACAMSLSAAWIFSRIFWPRSTTFEDDSIVNRIDTYKQCYSLTSSKCLAASWFSISSRRKLCVCNSCELSSFGSDSISVSISLAHLWK